METNKYLYSSNDVLDDKGILKQYSQSSTQQQSIPATLSDKIKMTKHTYFDRSASNSGWFSRQTHWHNNSKAINTSNF
ncbi:hypothetical protein Bca101_024710 [Brassica carinata]